MEGGVEIKEEEEPSEEDEPISENTSMGRSSRKTKIMRLKSRIISDHDYDSQRPSSQLKSPTS